MPGTGILQGVAGAMISKPTANSGKTCLYEANLSSPEKVFASRVDHSRHNTTGQFYGSRAIPARRTERHDESTGLESHVPPLSTSYGTWLGDTR